jgi:glycosyltransferase involved in cell wall biosynthesis
MTPLHVVLYHPDRLPVERYGGTERVVVWLARGLAELGHRVTVICAPGSHIPEARVVPIDPAIANHPGGPDLTALLPPDADVVHAHVPLGDPPRNVPFLWTHHGNNTLADPAPPGTVGLSADHARRHHIARWVYNGLDPAEYHFEPVKQDYDLFLGRLHSVKGWHWAVAGARRAQRSLVVAGGWRPTVRRGLRFVGNVGGERKAALLAGAACLWAPALWDEPFGLSTIEALVSGTPVLGTRRGALPEILTPACGLLGDTLDDLVDLRPRLAALDPEAIRQRVIDSFTHIVMAERYVELYRERMGATRTNLSS